jgi:O-antigen/teichoic acid export membrane protein
MSQPPQPSLSQRFAGAAAWNALLFPIQFVVGLLASVLMLRYLTLAEYGVLTLLTGLAATVGLLADLGIERSLPRFIPEIEQRAGRAGVARFLWRIIALKLLIVLLAGGLLVGLSSSLIGYLSNQEQQALAMIETQIRQLTEQQAPAAEIGALEERRDALRAVLDALANQGHLFLWAVFALVLFGALYDVGMQFLTAYFKQKAWNLITAVIALLQPVLITSFILLGWRLDGVLLGMVITPVVAVALAAWQTLRAARELRDPPGGGSDDPSLPGRFARYAAMSFVTQGTTWFYDMAFVSFMLIALGVRLDEMALLAFAYTYAKSYLSYAYLPFGGLLTPLLTRIRGRNDAAALKESYASLSRLFALILVPAGAGLLVITPWLLALLYPRYTDTALLAYVLISLAFAESLLSVPHNVLMVYERFRPVLIARLLALISIPLLLVLTPLFGLVGAAVAVGIARVLPRLVTLWYARRALGLAYPLAFLGRVAAATLAFCVPLLLLLPIWPLPPTVVAWQGKLLAGMSLVGLAGLAALIYGVVLKLLGGLDPQERQRILNLKLPFKKTLARLL